MVLPPVHNAAHTGVYVVEAFVSVFITIRFKKEIFLIPRIFLKEHVFAKLASFMEDFERKNGWKLSENFT